MNRSGVEMIQLPLPPLPLPLPRAPVRPVRLHVLPVLVLVLALVLAVLGPAAGAQSRYGQPIYPAYQGYVVNPDGSLTLVFQYFSHGRDPVTVPVGPGNSFTGIADRNQPTTFLPGNHEFICVMVVDDAEQAKALRWTIAFPEEPSSTTLDPLNSEYLLTERSQQEAQRDVDPAEAPRGVCLNKPPRVTTNSRRPPTVDGSAEREIQEVKAELGKELALNGSVNDEGLPRDGAMTSTWSKVSGPGSAEFADPGSPRTTVTFDAGGTYELELRATDGELEASDRIRVVVS